MMTSPIRHDQRDARPFGRDASTSGSVRPAALPLIFSHYGNSGYLEHTLRCARETNPRRRLILLGDKENLRIARKAGWEHFNLSDFAGPLLDEFRRSFRHVQGCAHVHTKNGGDWLKFVFQRWFHIDAFVRAAGVSRFWHFDSDTMLLHDLSLHDGLLDRYEFSVQCNGTCLNGFTHSAVVADFCRHIVRLFNDESFLERRQAELDAHHPDWAFTEMGAFEDFLLSAPPRPFVRLLSLPDSISFDECLCQDQGFETCRLQSGDVVKHVRVADGRFLGVRDGVDVEFASLNLSWLGDHVFEWVLQRRRAARADIREARESRVRRLRTWLGRFAVGP